MDILNGSWVSRHFNTRLMSSELIILKRLICGAYLAPPQRPFWNGTNTKGAVNSFITPMTERDRERRTDLRSIAPPEFTKAFFQANQ